MRVAVVGATGVYGRHLVPLLAQQGHEVRALVRSVERAASFAQIAEIRQADLLTPDIAARLPALLKDCDAVLHIATAIPRDASATGAWDTNTRLRTDGTRALLDATLAVGAKRYVQQSIVMAYPDSGDRWIDESTPLDDSPARATITAPVRAMEAMMRAVPTDRLAWCILRGGSFVGPGTAQEDLLARLRAGTVTVPCDGSHFISPIHVADMAAATVAALSAPAGSIFNIVAEPVRYGEYVDRLAARIGAPAPPRDSQQPCPPSYRCSNRAAREMLKWRPTHEWG